MANILIATLYIHQPIIAAATKISADRLILLIDEKPDENQQKALKLIQDSLGSVLEIKTVKTKTYDIVSIAEEAVGKAIQSQKLCIILYVRYYPSTRLFRTLSRRQNCRVFYKSSITCKLSV